MTYRWIWYIDCERHAFHKDHYKRSVVLTETRKHMKTCIETSPDDIKRRPAPNDIDY